MELTRKFDVSVATRRPHLFSRHRHRTIADVTVRHVLLLLFLRTLIGEVLFETATEAVVVVDGARHLNAKLSDFFEQQVEVETACVESCDRREKVETEEESDVDSKKHRGARIKRKDEKIR